MKNINHFIIVSFIMFSSLLLMSCDGESLDSLFEDSSRKIKSESLEDNELNKHSKGLHELISTLEENTKEDIKILNETLKNINQKIKTYRDEVKKAQIDINNINSKGESFKAESFKKDIETLENEIIKFKTKLEDMTKEYEKNDETINNIKAALENSKRKTDSEEIKKDIDRLRENLNKFKEVTEDKIEDVYKKIGDVSQIKESLGRLSGEINSLKNEKHEKNPESFEEMLSEMKADFNSTFVVSLSNQKAELNSMQINLKSLEEFIQDLNETLKNEKGDNNHHNESHQRDDGMSVSDRLKYMIFTLEEGFIAEAAYKFYRVGSDYFLNSPSEADFKQDVLTGSFVWINENQDVVVQPFSLFSAESWKIYLKETAFNMLPNPIQVFWTGFLPNLRKFILSNYLNSSPFFSKKAHPRLSQYTSRRNLFLVILTSQGLLYLVPLTSEYVLKPILHLLKDLALAPIYTAKGIVYDMPKHLLGY